MKNQTGLSLLEVMIGLTIISFISLAIFQASQSSFQLVEVTTREDKDKLNAFTALAMLEWDLSQLYSPLFFSEKFDLQQLNPQQAQRQQGQQGEPQGGGDPNRNREELRAIQQIIDLRYRDNRRFYLPNKDGIPIPRFITPTPFHFEFFTASNRRRVANSRQSQYAWVSYSLEASSKEDLERMRENDPNPNLNPGKMLVRRFYAGDPFGENDFESQEVMIRPQILLEKVDELEFTFWDYQTQRFTRIEDVFNGIGRLDAIKVKMRYRDLYDHIHIIERIFRPLWPKENHQPQNAPPRPRPSRPGQRIER